MLRRAQEHGEAAGTLRRDPWEVRKFTKGYAPTWMRCYVLMKRLTALRQADMLKIADDHLTDRGIEITIGKGGQKIIMRWSWALRMVVCAAQSLRPALPENVKPLAARALFPSRYGTTMSTKGFKTAWQRAMTAYAQAGHARFWEHDIRAKSASDSIDEASAQQLLVHASPATTRRHYRRAPTKVRPLR